MRTRLVLLAIAIATMACASQPADVARPVSDGDEPLVGYLLTPPDARLFLPPPPSAASALQAGEIDAVLMLSQTQDSSRRAQAIADNRIDPGQTFALTLGATIGPDVTPNLARVLGRLTNDIAAASGPAKDEYDRLRPFQVQAALAPCFAEDAALMARLANSRSYPSGHAALGWAWALILAEMAPERADAILARGHDYGWSRVVCGLHFPSDVAAGQLVAAATVAALHADPSFQRDFTLARIELRELLGLPL
jgi:acid phosphatase (class A)